MIEPEEFAKIIVKRTPDGRILRLKDVARVELGAKNQDISAKVNGMPTVGLAVFQLPDANALKTADMIKAKMETLEADFPAGVSYMIRYDTTPFIRESIGEVVKTLRDAILLVAMVVLLFLQNWRSAIIPLLTVPVAIIGTFAAMAAFGFSLNNLTLFGLVLAIGIVVDDAIVVVEAVEQQIERGLSPARGDHPRPRRGGPAGHRHRPGPDGDLRPVRRGLGHRRPVLPPVRADDRRQHRDLGLQLADPEPGPGRTPAPPAHRERPPPPRCPGERSRWSAALDRLVPARARSGASPGHAGRPGWIAGAGTLRGSPRPPRPWPAAVARLGRRAGP